jgi:hypothetical protein
MARRRKHLYRSISRNAASPASYFGLPADRVVSLGSGIDLWSRGNGVPFPRHQLLTHIR